MLFAEPDKDLRPLSTFGVSAQCDTYVRPDTVETLREALNLAHRKTMPWLLLGEGSNILLTRDQPGMVIRVAIPGIRFESEENDNVLVHAGAGVNWHTLVQTCMERGVYGVENLALIPGSVGAAPVQNIGAYGVELSDVLQRVEVMDAGSGDEYTMDLGECGFSYRDSVFRRELSGRRVITGLVLRLSTRPEPVLRYPSLMEHLQRRNRPPTPQQVFRSVCEIRRDRLPDPSRIGNAGSFFRNPVLDRNQYEALQEQVRSQYGELPFFPVADSEAVKVPAAWLIEKAGWKGYREGDAGVHDRQALVLVNHGSATGAEIAALATRISESIRELFGVQLEPEVTIL